jgi:hypothetical protein
VAEVKRFDQLELKLRFFEDQVGRQHLTEEELETSRYGGPGSWKRTLAPGIDELEVHSNAFACVTATRAIAL